MFYRLKVNDLFMLLYVWILIGSIRGSRMLLIVHGTDHLQMIVSWPTLEHTLFLSMHVFICVRSVLASFNPRHWLYKPNTRISFLPSSVLWIEISLADATTCTWCTYIYCVILILVFFILFLFSLFNSNSLPRIIIIYTAIFEYWIQAHQGITTYPHL